MKHNNDTQGSLKMFGNFKNMFALTMTDITWNLFEVMKT